MHPMEETQAAGMWPSLREWWKMYSTAGPMTGQHSLMTSGLISSGPDALLVGRRASALVILSGVRIVAGSRWIPSRALRIEGGESGNSVEARVERVSDGVVVISPSAFLREPSLSWALFAKVFLRREATGVERIDEQYALQLFLLEARISFRKTFFPSL